MDAACKIYGDHSPALMFHAPLVRPPHPRGTLSLPVAEREWLTRPAGAEFANVHPFTIRNWFIHQLLPHTHPYLFLRADRYNSRGIHYAALREELDHQP